ncbi:50S ribosomal protein L5 [Candidatus Microgenomates bacterium]|nr:50S ribosomal protein L5 [Candidatus Microgenomates bacterium]
MSRIYRLMKLEEKYKKEIVSQLIEEFKMKNALAVPRVTKVVINVGLKEAIDDKGVLEKVSEGLALITGQMPKVCQARKSIAGFKLRAGVPIGLMVSLRHKRMYAFLEKLFNIALPRVKDFQGVSPGSFDGNGNYTLGLEEQIVFPEIDSAKIEKIHGLEVTIVTSTYDDKKAKRFLELMGMPFKKNGEKK